MPAILALVCIGVAVGLLARLHLVPTGLNPVRDAVSDYGTTERHWSYRVMAAALGVGAALLAVALGQRTDAKALYWLYIFAASRIAIAEFMTDAGPDEVTIEGRIHWLLAAVAFTSIAFAASDISWSGDPGALRPLGYAVAASAVATLLTRMIPPGRVVFGLAERLLYVTMIAWLVTAAVDVLGRY